MYRIPCVPFAFYRILYRYQVAEWILQSDWSYSSLQYCFWIIIISDSITLYWTLLHNNVEMPSYITSSWSIFLYISICMSKKNKLLKMLIKFSLFLVPYISFTQAYVPLFSPLHSGNRELNHIFELSHILLYHPIPFTSSVQIKNRKIFCFSILNFL